jgi:hypothetical protein
MLSGIIAERYRREHFSIDKVLSWMTPTKLGKAAVVPVRCYPFASGFDRKGRKISIGDKIAFYSALPTEAGKDLPVPGTGTDVSTMRLITHFFAEVQSVAHRARRIEYRSMGYDSKETAQYNVRYTVRLVSVYQIFKPSPQRGMMRRILPVRVNQNVDVQQHHFRRSIRSRSEALSSRSTPGRGPFPSTTVRRILFLETGFGGRIAWRIASSIIDVIVLPVFAANSLRLVNKLSSRLIVVRMHQIISPSAYICFQ